MPNVQGKMFIHVTCSLGMESFIPGIIFLLGTAVGKPVGDVVLSLGQQYSIGK